MVPGMFERERLAAETRRRDWLIEMTRPQAPPTPGTARMPPDGLAALRSALCALREKAAAIGHPQPGHDWQS